MMISDQLCTAAGLKWLVPDWPAPAQVRAVSSLRSGGVSGSLYQGLNLGDHVNDDPAAVRENRSRLTQALKLPSTPCWLTQVHGVTVVNVARIQASAVEADAAMTTQAGIVCAVLTADCLPLLFCDRQGSRVAAVHAGWRGLAAGIVEAAVQALDVPANELLVWLGPAIGPAVFEVGAEVRNAFMVYDGEAQQAFQIRDQNGKQGRYLADIYLLARLRLQRLGVESIYGGHWCTYSQPDDFYSFRRDGVTGRQASLIWIA